MGYVQLAAPEQPACHQIEYPGQVVFRMLPWRHDGQLGAFRYQGYSHLSRGLAVANDTISISNQQVI
jgi:hypothetical protein